MLRLELPRYKNIEVISKKNTGTISFSQGAIKVGGTPHAIKEHIRSLLSQDIADYYQNGAGLDALRDKIADDLSSKHQMSFSASNILITHGAIGSITNICLTLLQEGDQVLIPEPTYPSYSNIVRFSKAEPLFPPAFIEDGNRWILDIDCLKAAITPKTKMIIISNPSNPCGFGLSQEILYALVSLCEAKGIYLLLDEVYDHFIYEGAFFSGMPFILSSQFVIRTGSFSKDFAMSGWRIGFTVAPSNLISLFAAIQDGTLCCPSVIGQHAALFALNHKHLIEEQISATKASYCLAMDCLKPLEGILSYIKPQAGIFLFVKTGHKDCEDLVMDILYKAKVALVPGKDFGTRQDCFRLCFAREKHIIQEGIDRLCAYFLR